MEIYVELDILISYFILNIWLSYGYVGFMGMLDFMINITLWLSFKKRKRKRERQGGITLWLCIFWDLILNPFFFWLTWEEI